MHIGKPTRFNAIAALACAVACVASGGAFAQTPQAPISPVQNAASPNGFVAAGHKAIVRFGDNTFRLDFTSAEKMTFLGITGPYKGVTDTVDYHAVPLRPNLYMVYWHEPHTGDNVVHIEDFEQHVVYTNIVHSNGDVVHMQGEIRLEDAP